MAGADDLVALRLAGSMLALQASIGALNDLVDAEADRARKPGKPIPRAVASPTEAAALAGAGLALGLLLSLVSNPATAAVALAGAGLGYLYDLRLSRTAWSWLPLALALPLVPLHAWLGVTGAAPPSVLGVIPVGILAGAGLAIGNGLADEQRDVSAGIRTVAVSLGRRRAWLVHGLALAAAVALAILSLRIAGAGDGWLPPTMLPAIALIGAGAVLLASPGEALRERGWELEALGVAGLGLVWLGAMAGLPS